MAHQEFRVRNRITVSCEIFSLSVQLVQGQLVAIRASAGQGAKKKQIIFVQYFPIDSDTTHGNSTLLEEFLDKGTPWICGIL